MYQNGPNFLDWFFLKIYKLITGDFNVSGPGQGFKNTVVFLLSLIGIFFFAVLVYSVKRLKERNKLNHDRYHHDIHHAGADHHHEEKESKKWDDVIKHIKSTTPGDWRVAIIEADSMLDKLTIDIGFVGDDLGERLKNASADHFRSLDNAWAAHKVRNRIAHEGLAYNMTYREAKKTIENYEMVFREFGVI